MHRPYAGFEEDVMRIGIVGAGKIGSTVAKLWVDAGHEVRLASRHPEELQPLVIEGVMGAITSRAAAPVSSPCVSNWRSGRPV
jgi:3-hydroxyisobutyrate dehydrogenase-like beta-hydroxyacid dehydrogenase